MSIARHHAEWLSLLDISGPFLSIPVLQNVFPQGLDAHDPEHYSELRAAYEEWLDNQGGLAPEPAIHTAWLQYVLENTLEYIPDVLANGQAIPAGIKATLPEHGEVLRPDYMIVDPDDHTPRMLIRAYPIQQGLERVVADRHWKASPAMRMMELLHATDIKLGLVTNGEQWMLVHAPRGETTGYISWYADLWTEEKLTLRAFRSLLSLHRFFGVAEDETLEAMIAASAQEQHEVTDQLGKQVRRAVEILVQAIDSADVDRDRTLLTNVDEGTLYEAALTVMMRLVFLLSAEERGLLLLGDPIYDQNYAISTLLGQQRELADQQTEDVLERRYDAWSRLLATFRAVYGGIQHDRLRLPAYGSSLFDPDKYPFLEGRLPETTWRMTSAHPLPINNRTVLHLLEALQYLQVAVPGSSAREARRLSFRALDIEQIGHVYEGLLDHVAVRADEPVFGFTGAGGKEPEIPLSSLEARSDFDDLAKFLTDETGRSASAINNGLKREPDAFRVGKLRTACDNDDDLVERVSPYLELLRDDDNGEPVVILPDSIYVTEGATRRQTGTHYTPRSLTEPIVQHTLEPLVYIGPAEGYPRDQWRLRSAADLLDLKICDMAMGSGAFLVQTCRYLSERLVEAWEEAAQGDLQITPEGQPATGDPGEMIIPADTEERLAMARRLIADRCLYGVDKNPLAVEMAKLSLWLITMDKGRAFSFLDHALKCGDSLIGVSLKQLGYWNLQPDDRQEMMIGWALREEIEDVIRLRREIAAIPVNIVDDQRYKSQLLAEANRRTDYLRRASDHLISEVMYGVQETNVLEHVIQKQELPLAEQLGDLKPFHWELEFPEVFLGTTSGFQGFVGNPPFMHGGRISTAYGDTYFNYLGVAFPSLQGQTDICALFFLRAFESLAIKGSFGLVATNTIAQGSTRKTGLDTIVHDSGDIFRARVSIRWPGNATVTVSVVHVTKGDYSGEKHINDDLVASISPYLDSGRPEQVYRLNQNSGIAFRGSDAMGKGFVLSPEEAEELIQRDPKNAEVLFPYMSGQDLNSNPDLNPSRWVIYFSNWSYEKAATYKDCMQIIRDKVYPERQKQKRKPRREKWWIFDTPRIELYETVAQLPRVMFHGFIGKYLCFAFVPNNIIYAGPHIVIALPEYKDFAVLQSSVHESWVSKYGSTLKTDISYSISNCFEPFPFPAPNVNCQPIGEEYYEHRHAVMLERWEGLTATYNRFHDPDETAEDIAHLRDLHVEMDCAVAAAYGWDDLDLGHDFHETAQGVRFTISESARRDVLTRLLKLNHARYEEEVKAGLHGKVGKGQKKAKKSEESKPNNGGQLSLF